MGLISYVTFRLARRTYDKVVNTTRINEEYMVTAFNYEKDNTRLTKLLFDIGAKHN